MGVRWDYDASREKGPKGRGRGPVGLVKGPNLDDWFEFHEMQKGLKLKGTKCRNEGFSMVFQHRQTEITAVGEAEAAQLTCFFCLCPTQVESYIMASHNITYCINDRIRLHPFSRYSIRDLE